jgi:hypothetical protein
MDATQSCLEAMEDKKEARMEYEGNIVSQELQRQLKEAKTYVKNEEIIQFNARDNIEM